MRSVRLVGIQLEPESGSPVLMLQEDDAPHRVLPIFVGSGEAASIAMAASGQRMHRPLTHDLMVSLVERLDAHIDAVEVTQLIDGSYLAELAVSGPTGPQRLDTRPSDAIAMAIRLHAPLFVADEVLDEAGLIPEVVDDTNEPVLDPDEIDAEVRDFRGFLDQLDPDDFGRDLPGDEPNDDEPNDD